MAFNKEIMLLDSDEISPGDVVVTDTHCHLPNTGLCANWAVADNMPMELTKTQFHEILRASQKEEDRGSLVMNKSLYAVSTVLGDDLKIAAVLGIYRYDFAFYITMLHAR